MMLMTSAPLKGPVFPKTVLGVSSHWRSVMGDLAGGAVELIAGECAGGLADVLLGVVALAEGEEFHHLAGEVFIGFAFFRILGVQINHHRGIHEDRLRQILEAAEGMFAEQFVLVDHEHRLFDLLDRGGEMIMPEKRHLFAQRGLGFQHAAEPPGLAFEGALAVFLLDFLECLAADFVGLFRRRGRGWTSACRGVVRRASRMSASACSSSAQAGGESVGRSAAASRESTAFSLPRAWKALISSGSAPESRAVEQVSGLDEGPVIFQLAGAWQ